MARLDENVYILSDVTPTKDDSDKDGKVLFFSPTVGWYEATWSNPYMGNTTHWTFLPERPPILEDRAAVLDRRFNLWIQDKFPNIEPAAKMLLRLGYEAGAGLK